MNCIIFTPYIQHSVCFLCVPIFPSLCLLSSVVKVMPFANLMGLLASGTDSTSVLRCIQQVALLVQGNWVVKRWDQTASTQINLEGERANVTKSFTQMKCVLKWILPLVMFLCVCFPSDVLYPKNTCSPHSGVPAEVLCRGRDFVVSSSFFYPFFNYPKLNQIPDVFCVCGRHHFRYKVTPLFLFCRFGGSLWSALWWERRLHPSSK